MAIFVRLMGGLGNQMFQYACARALSVYHHTDVLLDLEYLKDKSAKENFTNRDYELNIFNLQAAIATPVQLRKYNVYQLSRWDFYRLKFQRWVGKSVLRYWESGTNFNADIFQNTKKDTILIGFWQCEAYFKRIEQIIRKDFAFPRLSGEKNLICGEHIFQTNSVAIHIRRGDYLNSQTHAVCDKLYYQESIKFMNERLQSPHFYVFTEDEEWALRELDFIENVTFVNGNNGDKSFEDMHLMSLCKHQIIANSSFSWWGGWLNKNAQKIVIAPKKWFNDSTLNSDDILPLEWIKI